MKTLLLTTLLLATSLSALVPPAAATTHSELAILKAYLARGDASPGTMHCARTVSNNAILAQHYGWHATPTPSTSFLVFHHKIIGAYESWRAANGHPPLASWNPATSIPASFATDPACPARQTSSPNRALPTWATVAGGTDRAPIHQHTRLCQFRNDVELGQSLNGWHGGVHVAVGGDMASAASAPRDPVFWAWHRFVDDVYHTWERKCRFTYPYLDHWLAAAIPCHGVYEVRPHPYSHDDYSPGPAYGRCDDATRPIAPCTYVRCDATPCTFVAPCSYEAYVEAADGARDGAYRGAAERAEALAGPEMFRVVEPWAPSSGKGEPSDGCARATAIADAGGAYVVLDAEDQKPWIYRESNGVEGLQRGDETCDQSGEAGADTVVL